MEQIRIGDPTQLGNAIKKSMQKFTEEQQEEIARVVEETAKDCAKDIKADSQGKGWKNYARTWKAKKDRKVGWIIWNSKYYRIVHLLEKGHPIRNRDGQVVGSARAFPHVEPMSEKWNKILEQRLKRI